MKAVNQHCQERDFLLVAELRCEICRLNPGELFRDFYHLLLKWTKDVWLLALGVQEDQPDYFGPQLLLIVYDLVEGRQNLLLLFTLGRVSARVGLLLVLLFLGEQVSQVVISESRHQVIDHVEALLSDMLQLHLFSPVELFLHLFDVHFHSWITLFVVI